MDRQSEVFIPLRSAATRLGVPAAWLRQEVEAGRLPALRAGRRIYLHPYAVEMALIERGNRATVKAGQDHREAANA